MHNTFKQTEYLPLDDMAKVLDIKNNTLEILALSGSIPHTYICRQLHFDPFVVFEWMQSKPNLNIAAGEARVNFVNSLQAQFKTMCPNVVNDLKAIDNSFTQKKQPRLYSLHKVKDVYYVRYMRNGKMLPSRWSTYTKDKTLAELFAVQNRERIISEYDTRRTVGRSSLYKILETYYGKASMFQEEAQILLDRKINERSQRVFELHIRKVFLPYLKEHGIKELEELTPFVIRQYQIHLRKKGVKPQSVNSYLSGIKIIFDHLVLKNIAETNPFKSVNPLKTKGHRKTHGCVELDSMYGMFKREWQDELSYLLNLIIYSTDLRNSEIDRLQVQNLIEIDDCRFINIPETTKTKNESSVRLVPLHPFVYEKLSDYIRKMALKPAGYIFTKKGEANQSKIYSTAFAELAKRLKLTKEQIENENISFYSGRHYWKTLMNAHGLGEVEELFMGHAVSSDMKKLYNHRDKQGKEKLLEKAREVFLILDKTLFYQKRPLLSPEE